MSYAIEVKHCGGREPIETIINRYQPQCQWIMFCTGTSKIALSVIMGANEPIVEFLSRDDGYIAEMVRRGAQLMDCVQKRIPPVQLAPVPPPVVATKHYDMVGDNRWASAAATWLSTKAAAGDHAAAEKDLKEIVPPDAKKVTGYGVAITRNRIGYLSLKEIT